MASNMSSSSSKPAKPPAPPPGLWSIFLAWTLIGIQSFGGGSATFFLIQQTCIKRRWISEEEFLKFWALAQLSPGINLIKATILIGRRIRGWPGIAASLAGLLVPSVFVTGLMTAFYAGVQNSPVVKAAMRGILPATIGLSLAMSTKLLFPVMKAAYRENKLRFAAHGLILVGAVALMILTDFSPLLILLLTGLLTTLSILASPANLPLPQEGEAR